MRYFPTLIAILIATGFAACGGAANPTPSPAITPVYDVQGASATSPLNGQTVTVEGIVTGDFQDGDGDDTRNLGGFFIQGAPDAKVATSDGVFIFDGRNSAVDVAAGDRVRVEGMVNEHFGETQIEASSIVVTGTGSILPVEVNLPAALTTTNSDGELIPDLERYEGMFVRFSQALTVSGFYELERFGTVLLSGGSRQYQFTNRNAPAVTGYAAHRETAAARSVLLDDGLRAWNAPIPYLTAGAADDYTIRVGDETTGLTGVLRYSRGSGSSGKETFRLMPTVAPQFESKNPRPGAPVVDGAIRIASFNVQNFFSGIDSGKSVCGPSADANCRGADSSAEYARQLQKTVTALAILDADVVGLIELENNESESLQRIVDALNAEVGVGKYDYVDSGTIGDDGVKTGFIYKPETISPVGSVSILDSDVDARFDDSRNRPALAQTFAQSSNDARLTIIVNHLKSKGAACTAIGDPNLGDGQANCNGTRNSAAAALADWLATDPTGSDDSDFLIIGDLNAYLLEDPITTLRGAGFTNLAESAVGLDAYSYLFDGQIGALDHALATASLVPQVAGVLEWHINADEPRVFDYNLDFDRNPDLFDGSTPYRASDHDPLLIGLDLIH